MVANSVDSEEQQQKKFFLLLLLGTIFNDYFLKGAVHHWQWHEYLKVRLPCQLDPTMSFQIFTQVRRTTLTSVLYKNDCYMHCIGLCGGIYDTPPKKINPLTSFRVRSRRYDRQLELGCHGDSCSLSFSRNFNGDNDFYPLRTKTRWHELALSCRFKRFVLQLPLVSLNLTVMLAFFIETCAPNDYW